MNRNKVLVEIYGADIICASCVNSPSSKDTYDWLQAAIGRKYPNQPFTIEYIDIESTIEDERKKGIAQQILDDEYFFPLVMIDGKMIGEGHISLKPIFSEFEKQGYLSDSSTN
ncbi:YuzD family protein [Sporosarcina siberiensis]|uniref:YuzD family protein n=1 Tax=Sporosarcina siberiensis TaxID=1365606 RepID=A0ABW4SDI0_9BACL